MILISIGLWALALLALALSGLLLGEVLAAGLPGLEASAQEQSPPEPLAVLIPAHDEAAVLAQTLASLQLQLRPADRVIVVADNCTDETADIARSAGATVLERNDPERRGKGYALDYGLQALSTHPPETVIVVDADCLILPGALAQLQRQTRLSGRPAQAVYLMERPPAPGAKDRVSAFAFKVKNWVRPLGLTRLGWPCLLTGTGMAFPWAAIAAVNLASGHIVEDMKLGLDLAIAAYPPQLCPAAQVRGQLPAAGAARISQRTRWEHGHLQVLRQYVPRLLAAATRQRRWDLAVLALDLAVPPLSLLVLFGLGGAAIASAWGVFSGVWGPAGLFAAAGGCLLIAILTAWARFGREEISLRQLLGFPLYVLWKIPLYFRFLLKPQSQWIRTERDPAQ